MTRSRKIVPISLEEQKRIMELRRVSTYNRRNIRHYRRPPLPPPPITLFLEKITANRPVVRSGETRSMREIVSSTCYNLRGICQYIRTFADEMENLLTSVESIAPVVEGVVSSYTRSLKNKEKPEMAKNEEQTNMSRGNTTSSKNTEDSPPTELEKDLAPPSSPTRKMPTEAELKEFLNNPLVASLMQMVAKNLAAKK